MARPQSEKCRRCAKLPASEARQRYDCWSDEKNRCHRRRTYYRSRDRYNKTRRQKYRASKGDEISVEVVSPPTTLAAVLHLYRERVGDPLHAVGAELWVGQQKVAEIEPVHTLGMTGSQVKAYLRQVLGVFSQHQGVALERFEAQVELDPSTCPISPCPLRP